MCSMASSNGVDGMRSAFPSVSLQCDELDMTENTYYKWRKCLEDRGLITIEKQKVKNKFDRNLYFIEPVPIPKPEPELEAEPEIDPEPEPEKKPPLKQSEPYRKNWGMGKSSYRKISGTKNSGMKNSGTNSNSFNSNSFNNKKDKNPLPYSLGEVIQNLSVPMNLRKKIEVNREKIDFLNFDIFEFERFYNKFEWIKTNCSKDDLDYLNQWDIENILVTIFNSDIAIKKTTYGILKEFALNRLHYKKENYMEL